jgi:hypothetical protein
MGDAQLQFVADAPIEPGEGTMDAYSDECPTRPIPKDTITEVLAEERALVVFLRSTRPTLPASPVARGRRGSRLADLAAQIAAWHALSNCAAAP